MFSFSKELKEMFSHIDTAPDKTIIQTKILKLLEKEGLDPFKINFEVVLEDNAIFLEAKDFHTKQALAKLCTNRDKIDLMEIFFNMLKENGLVFNKTPIWVEREGESSLEVEAEFMYKDHFTPYVINIRDKVNKVKLLDTVLFKVYLKEEPYSKHLFTQEIIFNNWEKNDWEILQTLTRLITFNLESLPEDIKFTKASI